MSLTSIGHEYRPFLGSALLVLSVRRLRKTFALRVGEGIKVSIVKFCLFY